MNKNKQSYSNTIPSGSGKSAHIEADKSYSPGRVKKGDNNHNAFDKSDYSTRKMTFGKIKYVQK